MKVNGTAVIQTILFKNRRTFDLSQQHGVGNWQNPDRLYSQILPFGVSELIKGF
jgi:hypothetical protein